MGKLSVKAIHKLCMEGVISIVDYWKIKKRRKKINFRTSYSRKPFNIQKFSTEDCTLLFRFSQTEIEKLIVGLKIPTTCKIPNGTSFSGLEGFCILLRRLCYPNRLVDIVPIFNRDPGTLSKIFNFMLDKIYTTNIGLLKTLQQKYIKTEKLQDFAESSSINGSPYPNIVGYIDGTARSICRPTHQQKIMYSGYKKRHVVKYQSIIWPNGLIGRLDGPFVGRRHDAAILHLSGCLREMEQFFLNEDGTWYAVYGDPGYTNQKFVKVGYKNYGRLNEKQKQFNATMSSLRIGAEYGFGKLIQQFAFLDFAKNQKLFLHPLKKMYYVAVILSNCQTCLRGSNQITDIFGCMPPTIEEYLSQT